ncbi:hypothetical protein [Streptomyces sp. FIT100]|uniref:hypothetical protein n=1 Tax=Streptomyces sp. FIT100 TaxID=2837956 RepID=UPI0021C984CA|nr:hypothetical protein [Streptomyces sp. FIT100]UUN30609.1 hypothetical protein KK483_32935 [Streptomyces sp. FIT100]
MGFPWREYRDLLITADQWLGGAIVLIWDILNICSPSATTASWTGHVARHSTTGRREAIQDGADALITPARP